MKEVKIGKAVIRHADTLVPLDEVEEEKRARGAEARRMLAEIDSKKPDELTLADINRKLDVILSRL